MPPFSGADHTQGAGKRNTPNNFTNSTNTCPATVLTALRSFVKADRFDRSDRSDRSDRGARVDRSDDLCDPTPLRYEPFFEAWGDAPHEFASVCEHQNNLNHFFAPDVRLWR
jgi:hypothetical protein